MSEMVREISTKFLTPRVQSVHLPLFAKNRFPNIFGYHCCRQVEVLSKWKNILNRKIVIFDKIINAYWDALFLLFQKKFFFSCDVIR